MNTEAEFSFAADIEACLNEGRFRDYAADYFDARLNGDEKAQLQHEKFLPQYPGHVQREDLNFVFRAGVPVPKAAIICDFISMQDALAAVQPALNRWLGADAQLWQDRHPDEAARADLIISIYASDLHKPLPGNSRSFNMDRNFFTDGVVEDFRRACPRRQNRTRALYSNTEFTAAYTYFKQDPAIPLGVALWQASLNAGAATMQKQVSWLRGQGGLNWQTDKEAQRLMNLLHFLGAAALHDNVTFTVPLLLYNAWREIGDEKAFTRQAGDAMRLAAQGGLFRGVHKKDGEERVFMCPAGKDLLEQWSLPQAGLEYYLELGREKVDAPEFEPVAKKLRSFLPIKNAIFRCVILRRRVKPWQAGSRSARGVAPCIKLRVRSFNMPTGG